MGGWVHGQLGLKKIGKSKTVCATNDLPLFPPAKKACSVHVCDRVFPTPHYLNKHKKEMGHMKKK